MGLDMYAYKRTYVGNQYEKDLKKQVRVLPPQEEGGYKGQVKLIDQSKVSEIKENIAYWRKANAIHNWFVNNIQDGEDDCKEYEFGVEEMQKLVDICKTILDTAKTDTGMIVNGQTMKDGEWENIMGEGIIVTNPEEVAELLPPTSGFFFGSTEIDSYFLDDIKSTIDQFEPYLIKDEEDQYVYRLAHFSYQSSW